MTRIDRLLNGKLVLATIVATGMAAAPVALSGSNVVQMNASVAQTSGSNNEAGAAAGDDRGGGHEGFAEEKAERRATGTAGTTGSTEYDVDMMAQEDNVYRILGTSRQEAEAADTHTSATAQYGPLQAYQAEVERGNLDAAAENLANISNRPVTEQLVSDVNTELGIETRLTSQQIAETAARKQSENGN